MARRKMSTKPATELEAAVLGVVWRNGPCTPYAIRQHFSESRTPRWSGSAGAIYPLVRRLEVRGLVRSKHTARGKRTQRDYRITPIGVAAFRHWLKATPGVMDTTLVHDPLRTRVLFLAALPQNEVQPFLSDAIDALRREERLSKADCHKSANNKCLFSHFAAKNALLLTRVRIRWLIEIQTELGKRAEC